MKKIKCSSVVTKKSYKEFLLLKFSLELFHEVDWYLSTDDFTYRALRGEVPEKNMLPIIESDDGTHGSNDPRKNEIHMKMMMTKFDACELALKTKGGVLFLDSDMIFLNPLEESILSILESKTIDAAVCPHSTENKSVEAKVGTYNGGMFIMNSTKLLNEWKQMSLQYKELNMYFEQQPLEYAIKNYLTCNLPINYNVGWWRMNENWTKYRLNRIGIKDDKITFFELPLINVHVHSLKELEYENYGDFLLQTILLICNKLQFKNKNYHDILNEFSRLLNMEY